MVKGDFIIMEYKFIFNSEEEKEQLIKDNPNLTLIKIAYHLDGKHLVFTDEEVVYELTENEILANKISILESENQVLKEELTQIQTSIDSLTSLLATTLKEK